MHGLAELAKQIALHLRQLLRRLHYNLHHQISSTVLVEMRNTLAAEAELLARLRALMDPQRGVAFECRHLNLVTQRKLREGNENDTIKVVAIAFEELVLPLPREQHRDLP